MSIAQPNQTGAGPSGSASNAGNSARIATVPRPLTTFVGRDRLVADVLSLLGDQRVPLLTLTGPGGVGKTRLAIAAAESLSPTFPGGVVFVPLAGVTDPDMVIPAIADALEISHAGDRPLIARIAHELADRRRLLVLDNLEHVLGAGPAIAELLQAARGAAALVTSRSPLRVHGEREYAVGPLGLPPRTRTPTPADLLATEAGSLFVQRARSVRPGFVLDEVNVVAVAEICRRLDGLPLALELAAARTKVLSPTDLLARLERKLYVLTGGRSDAPTRQRTMRDAIAWSYGLLDADLQTLFRRISVFRGGISIDAAEALFGDPSSPVAITASPGFDILDGLEQLVDQSLLTPPVRDERAADESRLLMLETIREFGLEQLGLHGEDAAVLGAFADLWRAQAEASWAVAGRTDRLNPALDRLEADHDNIRAALDWLAAADPARAIDLAGALFWLWYVRGHHAEALHWLQRMLAAAPPRTPRRSLARAQMAAAAFSHFQVRRDQATRYAEEALVLWRDLDDPWGIGFTHMILGLIGEDTGDYPRARAHFDLAIPNLVAANDAAMIGTVRFHLATVAFGLGNLDDAEALLASVLDDRDAPALRIAAWATHLRGLVAQARGDAQAAFDYLQDGLRQFLATKAVGGYGDSLAGLAVVLASFGDPIAARLWAAATKMNDELGEKFHEPELTAYEAAMSRLAPVIGPDAFAAEVAIGRAWTRDEAIHAAQALNPRFTQPPHPARAPVVATSVGLSARETEILALVAQGWTNDKIADRLFLSPRTVHAHLTSVYRKLGVANRTEAVRVATERGLH